MLLLHVVLTRCLNPQQLVHCLCCMLFYQTFNAAAAAAHTQKDAMLHDPPACHSSYTSHHKAARPRNELCHCLCVCTTGGEEERGGRGLTNQQTASSRLTNPVPNSEQQTKSVSLPSLPSTVPTWLGLGLELLRVLSEQRVIHGRVVTGVQHNPHHFGSS